MFGWFLVLFSIAVKLSVIGNDKKFQSVILLFVVELRIQNNEPLVLNKGIGGSCQLKNNREAVLKAGHLFLPIYFSCTGIYMS